MALVEDFLKVEALQGKVLEIGSGVVIFSGSHSLFVHPSAVHLFVGRSSVVGHSVAAMVLLPPVRTGVQVCRGSMKGFERVKFLGRDLGEGNSVSVFPWDVG